MSVLFVNLIWWQIVLLGIYFMYILIRGVYYFSNGIKETLLGYRERELRLYHIILLIIDLPAMVIGRFYHVIKFIFSFKIYTFKEGENK